MTKNFVIDVSNGPTGALASKVLDNVVESEKYGDLTGEKLILNHLQPKNGFKVIDVTVIGYDEDKILTDKAEIRLTADCSMFDLSEKSEVFEEKLKEWLTPEAEEDEEDAEEAEEDQEVAEDQKAAEDQEATEDAEEAEEDQEGEDDEADPEAEDDEMDEEDEMDAEVAEDEDDEEASHETGNFVLKDYKIEDSVSENGTREIVATVQFSSYNVVDGAESFKTTPFVVDFWDKHMASVITEGVCYSNKKVPNDFKTSLRKNLDKLAKESIVDFHPNSKDIVRDLVHPALYSYVKGVSKFKGGKSQKDFDNSANLKKDFWGRKYEDSIFQWLPTPFHLSEDGKCSIQEYINNLSREKFPGLYTDLELLFEIFLPYFEEVWSYAKAMNFWAGDESDNEDEDEDPVLKFEKEAVSFKGKELQVITKIVEYNLKPGQSYEGVWHAEGMSHENIVMTGIYFIDRDVDLKGGDLRFKRAFHQSERTKVFWNVPQDRDAVVNTFAHDGFMPLGKFPTEEGNMLVFPNCHIHKISHLINQSKMKDASRRIVVFFVINPDKSIISTREIEPQQDTIPLSTAKQNRLDLMVERKYNKEKLNVRDIELCEH